MDFYQHIQFSDLLLISVEIALALTVIFKVRITRIKTSFLVCALTAGVWHLSMPIQLNSVFINSIQFLLIESLRYLTLLLMLLCLLMISRNTKLPLVWTRTFIISIPAFIFLFSYSLTLEVTKLPFSGLWLYVKMLFCLFGIIICEQLLRHEHTSRMAKLVALSSLTIFAYDIVVFSSVLLFADQNQDLWHARSFISSATSLIMALSIIFYASQLKQRGQFKLSNSIILFNTSLTLVGGFLLLMALFGSVFNFFEISWLNASKIMLYVLAIFSIIAVSFSEKARLTVVVWTSKHFFAHKYDYKQQWIKLDQLLTHQGNGYEISLKAMTKLFSCQSGAIWIKGPQFYSLISSLKIPPLSNNTIERNSSEFIRLLEQQDWIFQPSNTKSEINKNYNTNLPCWLKEIEDPWVIVPLNSEKELIGFIVLAQQRVSTELTWEDLDILKLTGRQIASYISHQQDHEKLIQNQQFDMFNKITAFAIHDIKNLIAQQALVVKNAEKFKHHPEFIDDAIDTIANSVQKMDKLLVKLQGKHRNETELINLNQLLIKAVEMNKNSLPAPSLFIQTKTIKLKSDPEKILMALNHLIKNAQDATPDNGIINITLHHQDNAIWLDVQDNGSGMSQEFINNELFKPFNSTKHDKGMGLGAFQIREIFHALGGQFFVESTVNEGSKFSIHIPDNTKLIFI
jgi:putative PEP-CTERM system histidine kinase